VERVPRMAMNDIETKCQGSRWVYRMFETDIPIFQENLSYFPAIKYTVLLVLMTSSMQFFFKGVPIKTHPITELVCGRFYFTA